MTQGEFEQIPQEVIKQMSVLELRILSDIVRRIKVNGFSTASADWQMTRLQQLGESEADIKKWIREALRVTDAELNRIFDDDL
ncbi:phage minor capsid protein [Ruminococcus sp. OA3]|uniref:phage minor capsid protein n=1 Tax=Ruminococcus sp. OA3 TaxID=2914164 RepID=UPI001F05245C|nr:phage minor capsid protein [Ruminococcus sp. OA3]MCH1983956.1 phage minor capsid protein [Ruminococcus sp. OA3]